jgi:type II secretory ATPase GspE/PulE/Tfp pilus assembly ATPase PilB-like protein
MIGLSRRGAAPSARRSAADRRREAVIEDLRERGLVDELTLTRAREVAARTRQPVEQALNQLGVVSEGATVESYARVSGCKIWTPDELPVALGAGDLPVSTAYLRQRRLLPVARTDTHLLVAACDPLDDEALAALVFATGLTVEILVAGPSDWRQAFNQAYGEAAPVAQLDERRLEQDVQRVVDTGADSEAARLLNSAFEAAMSRAASDLHFEPRRHDLRIRLRVDGRLLDHACVAADLAAPVVSRIKVLASLDLGERRLPQDGRSTFVVAGRPIDVRVSILPSAFGEAAVLRLLDRTAAGFDFPELGFSDEQIGLLDRIAAAPHGIFLVTGPTGSGKTTTLYALLNSLAGSQKKILSIEDPIEYHFQHVVQTQAAPAIGLSFATALRSFLRQDPDVILVGEIRDPETAEVAIQAAMTGHLVLASLHANDAVKVVPRLLDMGVEPYQLAAAVLGAAAQRLVRRLCSECRKERALTRAEAAFVASVGVGGLHTAYDPAGCTACSGSGYRGRVALAEAFLCDEAMTAAIAERRPLASLAETARRGGLVPLLADGCTKAGQGLTTFREVMAAGGT